MSVIERLTKALLAADDIAPDAIGAMVHDDSAFPEAARVLTIADEWLAQDIADGEALRLLRDALPEAKVEVVEYTLIKSGRLVVAVGVEKRRPVRVGRSTFIRAWGEGNTIAAAADACREALR